MLSVTVWVGVVLLGQLDGGAAAAPAQDGTAELRAARQLLDEGDNTDAVLKQVVAGFDRALMGGLSPADTARAQVGRSVAFMRLGQLARGADDKVRWFEQGTRAAEAALKADPLSADAHFYRGSNIGLVAQTKGMIKGLTSLPTIKGCYQAALKANPRHSYARLAMGKIDQMVPGWAGGSDARAEAAFRGVLKDDPHFTPVMLDLAELLADDDREVEALQLVERVLEETEPTHPGDWRRFDRPKAEAMAVRLRPKVKR